MKTLITYYSFFDNEMDFAITQIRFYLDAFNNYNLKTTCRSRLCLLQKFMNLEYNLDVISGIFANVTPEQQSYLKV